MRSCTGGSWLGCDSCPCGSVCQTANMTADAQPLRVVEDTVIVEYGAFLLSDFPEESRTWTPDFGGSSVQGGLGSVYLLSAGNDHYPAVTIDVLSGEPAALADWELVDETIATFRVPCVRLLSITSQLGEYVIDLPRAGRWNIRGYSAGRRAIEDMGAAAFATGVEHWRLQMWPVL